MAQDQTAVRSALKKTQRSAQNYTHSYTQINACNLAIYFFPSATNVGKVFLFSLRAERSCRKLHTRCLPLQRGNAEGGELGITGQISLKMFDISDFTQSGDVAAVSRSYAATPAGHEVRKAVLIIPGEKVLGGQLFVLMFMCFSILEVARVI